MSQSYVVKPTDAELLRAVADAMVGHGIVGNGKDGDAYEMYGLGRDIAPRLREIAERLENGHIVTQGVVERPPLFIDPDA